MSCRSRVLLLVLLLSPPVGAAAAATLLVKRADGAQVRFDVELARDDTQRARGLMYRRALPARAGMWFDFGREREVQMWMKNTYIALDMVFVDSAGVVRGVHQGAEPLSLNRIHAPVAVRYVLELNAGEARRYAIARGDSMVLITP